MKQICISYTDSVTGTNDCFYANINGAVTCDAIGKALTALAKHYGADDASSCLYLFNNGEGVYVFVTAQTDTTYFGKVMLCGFVYETFVVDESRVTVDVE